MSRIVKPQSASTLRKKILQNIAHSLHWAAQTQSEELEIMDMAAFIVLSLSQIAESVDQTATAWEKRDYWLKADRFRLEWIWVERSIKSLTQALDSKDWGGLAAAFGELASHVSDVKVPQGIKTSRPWDGAYQAWRSETG